VAGLSPSCSDSPSATLWGARSACTWARGLRTFAFAVGIYNYGFIPIPLMESLFGRESLGVLLVQNMGCEVAVWSVGCWLLTGLSAVTAVSGGESADLARW